MRLIHTASRWGNMYNSRYFLNGKRIGKVYAESLIGNTPDVNRGAMETMEYGFRVIWNFA